MNPYWLRLARGKVADHSPVFKFAQAPDIDVADGLSVIWDGCSDLLGMPKTTEYTFSTSADITQITSSSALDTQRVTIEGLDENGILTVQDVTVTGQTPAILSTPLERIWRVKNRGPADLEGDLYVTTTGATLAAGVPSDGSQCRAAVHKANQQTEHGIYTVPAGHNLCITQAWSNIAKETTTEAIIQIFTRLPGEVFCVNHTLSLSTNGTGESQRPYTLPICFPEKTDIVYKAQVFANNSSISAGFHGVLQREY